MMRTRTWLLLSGTLGAHLFDLASDTESASWWGDAGRTVSGLMLFAAVRHPRLSDEWPADQQVVVHDVEPAGRARVLALLGKDDAASWDALGTVMTDGPWTVASRLTRRRAGQVVAYLTDLGVRAECADDPRVKAHRGVLRAVPLVVGLGSLLANGTLVNLSMFPSLLQVLALVGGWLAVVAIAYVGADLVFASRPPRPSDWEPELEVTGPYDIELVSLPDGWTDMLPAIRLVLDLDLRTAMKLGDDLPKVVNAGLSRVEAERLVAAVIASGGQAVVVRRSEHEPEAS